MEREQHVAALPRRLLQVGAVAVLVAAGALGIARVFQGSVAPLKLLAAALASVAIASLLQRRSPLLAVLASAVGLLFAVAILVFPDTLYGIFPTAKTFGDVGRALHQVSREARVQVAPTEPLRPLLLAALTAVWAASFASHALAVRSGSPLLAALPQASLVAFADIILESTARPQLAALFLVGALAVLFLDGLRRVEQWGPLHAWPGSTRRRITSPTATRGARRLAIVALASALILPGVLPGYQRAGLLNLDTGPVSPSAVINPLVSVTASLHRQQPVDLFLVRTSIPSYWRWMSLDDFDGTTWRTDDMDVSQGAIVASGGAMARTPVERLALGVKQTSVTQTFTLLHPAGEWLPMAFHPDAVEVGKSSVKYDPVMTAAVPEVGAQPGLQYSVVSSVVEPTHAQLESVAQNAYDPRVNPQILPDEVLPRTPQTAELRSIARQETAGRTTPFDKVLALQNWLQSGGKFRYDQSVSGAYDVKSLVNFLLVTKRGFCQQFASAMAVMARALGYPARVAVGFTPGVFDQKQDAYRVTTANAHTWVEVLFPGYGWIPFEPTPTRANPAASYLGTSRACVRNGTCGDGSGPSSGHGKKKTKRGTNRERFLEHNQHRPTPSRERHLRLPAPRRSATRWLIPVAVLLLAVALILFLLVLPVAKWAGRRIRVARAREPRELVLATFDAFSGRASDLGLARRPGETLREYRDRLRTGVRFSDGHLERLTGTVARAAYGAEPISGEEAAGAVAASRRTIRDMRRSAPLGRRVAGTFRPGR